jgi:predicted acylesterase/phospholipase RssA
MSAFNASSPRLLRTYAVRENQGYNCTIWQAARATSAAPTFFKSIRFGEEGAEEEFVDGGLRCNNPVKQVLEEAEAVFGPDRHIACIVSVGTGQGEVIGLKSPGVFQRALPLDLIRTLKDIVVDCEGAAEEVEKRFKNRKNVYFRFNVEHGLQRVTLEEWRKLGEVTTHTKQYLQKLVISQKINAAVEALRKRPAVVAIAELST